jgi:hypothetical protein
VDVENVRPVAVPERVRQFLFPPGKKWTTWFYA